ncbi:hypothetical protein G4Y79_05935 [Phototrophicus methaneseepsis]|uniref:Endonuclease/exonuclease/phosphatase domain-containing protein n=1 Tax=Phototrophicus methaneseepsis TaxID=2710758 RepID=A0A7S8EBH2_9CHLR|nr:endonuclease/exonuclease/phosphatase family protein [Phototrophicus methaneseepsis]QPC83917.1 hypothetical protein G4Y79_05935 [Phototrophicus methaneseepsis]
MSPENVVDPSDDGSVQGTPTGAAIEGQPSSAVNLGTVGLVALMMALSMQILRAFGVLIINNMVWWQGEVTAGAIILLVLFAPLLAPLLIRRLGPVRAFLGALSILALIRLMMQVALAPQDVSPILAWLGLAFALLSWVLAIVYLRSAFGRTQAAYIFALGFVLGLSLDTTLHSAYLTWDYLWQPGAAPFLTALLLSAAVWFLAWRQRSQSVTLGQEAPLSAQLTLAVLPSLVIGYAFYWQNVALLSAAVAVNTALATALLLAMNAGVLLVLQRFGGSEGTRLRFFLSLIVVLLTVWLIPISDGLMTLTLIAMGQLSALLLLHEGLVGRFVTTGYVASWRTSLVLFGGNVLLILLGLAYYGRIRANLFSEIGEVPILVAGALMIVVTLLSLQWGTQARLRIAPVLPLLGLIVPLILILSQPAFVVQRPTETIRVMSYNTHYSVGMDGLPDVEAIAQVIESQGADIVLLQESSRGRLNSSGVDMAEWLSRRLQMPFAHAPASDYTQGVTTLSRIPIDTAVFDELPMVGESEQRRYLMTTHPLPDGESLRVINTHLAAAWLEPTARLPQFSVLLDVWAQQPRTLIAGDMNTAPGNMDINMMLNAGLVSVQDAIGDPEAGTVSADYPHVRYDWILTSPDIELSDFAIPSTLASDHLPAAVTITVP